MDADSSQYRSKVLEQEVASGAGEGPSSVLDSENAEVPVKPILPDIPSTSEFDLELAITSVVGVSPTEEEEKLHKRASSVLKLTQENEKLRAELKAMTDRLEAAERRKQAALRAGEGRETREQHIMEHPAS